MHHYLIEIASVPDAAIPGVARGIRQAKDSFSAVEDFRRGAGMAYQHGIAKCQKVKSVERDAAMDEMVEFLHEGFK